jgi:hypothetical protein
MATPGYPQMQQPPMMQGGPMGAQMPPRPIKRGVSRAVPVVVSAGLAVGVFCGLLFGLGTGDQIAHAEPSKGNNVHPNSGTDDTAPPPSTTSGTAPVAKSGGGIGSGSNGANPVAATTGSGAGSAKPAAATGSGTGSAAAVTMAKLTIEVLPPAAAAVAKISVDGKELTASASATPAAGSAAGSAATPPMSVDLPAETKSVKIAVTASGYHSLDKRVDVTAGAETKVQLELVKRSSGGGSPGFGGASNVPNRVPTAPPKPKKPANSGIIDI